MRRTPPIPAPVLVAMLVATLLPFSLAAQSGENDANAAPGSPTKPAPKSFLVDTGTRIPLSLINSVSTKNSIPGDRVYLETVFPILVDGRIVADRPNANVVRRSGAAFSESGPRDAVAPH